MQPGDVIVGRFEVEALAGAGGMGRVHRARDRHTGDAVALKVLLRDDASHAARFAHEARALAELSHPCIVRYVAHGLTETDEPYLAMEWLDGEDLSHRLERGALSPEQAVGLASRVAEALGAAHARGIVHRDIKPSNVFLLGERTDQIKVLDFGIARLASSTRMTSTGMMVGTPGYMAPEQVQNGRAVDARADVFSLGCVLFECLTGTRAFAGEQLVAVLAKVIFTEPPRLRELLPEAPLPLERLVAQLLAKNPEERPRDGTAVVEALAALEHEVGEATAVAATYPSMALTRNERRMVSVVLIHDEAPIVGDEQTLDDAEASAVEVLRHGAEVFGGRLEQLRDGSIVVSIAGSGPPTDQAAQAARCALWLRDQTNAHMLALATGRGELTGRKTAAEAIDRAASLLDRTLPDALAADRAAAIPIDETTTRLLDGRFDVREHETGPMLHGERELADGSRSLLGKPTPCVGRDRELSTLVELFCGCVEDSQAQVALVTGAAGIGKSRLVHELLVRLRERVEPFSVWIGRGDALRAGSALSLIAQAVRGACGIRGDEPLEERRDRLSARVARHVQAGERRRVAELLGELVDAPFPAEDGELLRAARMNAQIMAGELCRAWVDFLRAELEARPMLLVLEDLHWGDSPSVRFIDVALRELGEARWMVLALARPEVHELFPRLWSDRGMQTIALARLGKAASERLVRQVLGDEIGDETLARIVAQADGNAFYLEELMRAVAERRTDALPETVVAMVQSRVAALADEDRRVLRAAAVFGEAFWPTGVAVLLGGEELAATVERALAELVEREVLVRRSESRFLRQEELAFRHMLLREGAYEMLTDEDRALGHRLAGEWLEQVGERDARLLAGHFDRGGDGPRAAIHLLRAAEQAIEIGDAPAALTLAERGADSCTEPEVLAKLRTVEAEARFWSGDIGGASRTAADALRSARSGSHTEARALNVAIWSVNFRNDDSLAQSINALLHTDPADEAIALHVSTLHAVITSLLLTARRNVAEMCLHRLEQLASSRMDHDSFVAAWVELARAAWATHIERDFWRSRECYRRYTAHQEGWAHRGMFPHGQVFVGLFDALLGLFDESDRAFEVARASIANAEWSYFRLYHGVALLQRSRLDEACSTFARVIQDSKNQGSLLQELSSRAFLAEALIRAGRIDAAESEARALDDAVGTEPYLMMQYRTVLAYLRLAQGRAQDASTLAEATFSESHTHGMGCATTHAMLLLVRAEAFHALGNHAAARQAIQEAEADLLRRAALIPEPGVRRSFLENLPDHRRTLELARQWLAEARPRGQ